VYGPYKERECLERVIKLFQKKEKLYSLVDLV
jgi:hypothetical protein